VWSFLRRHGLADKAKALVNGHMVLLAKAGDRNVDLRLAISSRAGFSKLHGPSRIDILLGGFGRLIRQISCAALPAFIESVSYYVLHCLGAAMRVASTICPPHCQISIGAMPMIKGVTQHLLCSGIS
jgi:hypothetical protein